MHPILFKFAGLEVHAYGFFVALGFLAGIFLALFFAKQEKIEGQIILDLSIYVIISSVIGARLIYVIGEWDYFRHNPIEIIMVQNGGLVFLGGFLLAMATIVIFARVKKLNLFKLLDAIMPGALLGYAIGRLGCFFNGCCFGLPTKLPWAIIFPPGSLAGAYCPDQPLHPTQLYASLSMLLAFIILSILYRRKRFDGQIFFWGIIFYSIYRFLVEFLRFSPIHWLSLTPSQWLLLFTFLYGFWGLFIRKKSNLSE